MADTADNDMVHPARLSSAALFIFVFFAAVLCDLCGESI